MPPRQFIERQMCFRIAQREAHNDILATELPPDPVRGPFLRHGSAQPLDPDEVPFRHRRTFRTGDERSNVTRIPPSCIFALKTGRFKGSA